MGHVEQFEKQQEYEYIRYEDEKLIRKDNSMK